MAVENRGSTETIDAVVRRLEARIKRLEEAVVVLADTLGTPNLDGLEGHAVAKLQQLADEIRRQAK